jgi:hypothetical protein
MSIILPTRFSAPHRLIQHYINPATFGVTINNEIFFSASPNGERFNYCTQGAALARPQSPAWDITTAPAASYQYLNPTIVSFPFSFDVTDNGFRLIAGGINNSGTYRIAGYDLSTVNDISSTSATLQGVINVQDITGWTAGNRGLFYIKVKPDGMKLICQDDTSKSYIQLDFTTAWDVTTLEYNGVSENLSNQGKSFVPFNGRYLFVHNLGTVYQYYMSEAWELSSVGNSISSNSLGSFGSVMRGFHVDDDKMTAYNPSTLYQFYYTEP